MKNKILNIIILGPQGSGKGTQAKILAGKYKLTYIGTGDIFRKLARKKTAIGRQVNHLINDQGSLIPSDFVVKVVSLELMKASKNKGLLFDGYPRNLKQAHALEVVMKKLKREFTHIFYLPISKNITIKRLTLRRTCKKCNRIFVLGVNIDRKQIICQHCGGQIYQRDDDKPKAIANRLEIYQKQTKPIVNYYQKQSLLIRVNGEPPIKTVTKEIIKHLP
ncbi:nucleoside monophosphate kinase [Patescibacteria group bacterium]|nr:nucleoside monophosphate kinase [Patescibacteria group bacterium]MBU0964240.1 nucleoside monophosphate kinase [Patescibacteria group bacterium]